jgi:hypothetical protein
MNQTTEIILSESPVMRHLQARLNTRVKITCKDDLKVEGILSAVDYPRMWLEVQGFRKSYFVNMHKIAVIEAVHTEEAVSMAEKRRRNGP